MNSKKFISPEIYAAAECIHEMFKGRVIFGGSLSLALYDFLDREVGDMDAILLDPLPWDPDAAFELEKYTVLRKKLTVMGVTVDFMYEESGRLAASDTLDAKLPSGLVIRTQNPENVIRLKAYRAASGQSASELKHLRDVEFYKERIASLEEGLQKLTASHQSELSEQYMQDLGQKLEPSGGDGDVKFTAHGTRTVYDFLRRVLKNPLK